MKNKNTQEINMKEKGMKEKDMKENTPEENNMEEVGMEEKNTDKGHMEEELREILGSEYFRRDYKEVCMLLESRLQQINTKVSAQIHRDFINSVEWRVKSPDSCIRKLKCKGRELTLENAAEKLNDIAGVRVVCSFLDDMYQLCHQIASDYGYEFIKQKDYVKKPKSSGYQSLHLIIGVPLSDGRKVKAEIQFRTQAMDFWAGVEHHFVYKSDEHPNKELEKELRKCARAIYRIDKKMMKIRNCIEEKRIF